MAWSSGRAPNDWQTVMIIPTHKRGNMGKCTNYRGISLLRKSVCQVPCKNLSRNNWTETWWYLVGFLSRP